MSKTQLHNLYPMDKINMFSFEEIDLCKPDILESQQLPQLRRGNSDFSMMQSFQNLENGEEIEKLYDDISIVQTLEYQKQPVVQNQVKDQKTTTKKSVKQQKNQNFKKLKHSHFLSEEEPEDKSNQQEEFEQTNLIEQKNSNKVNSDLVSNIKQYWTNKNTKLNEIFKIRQRKEDCVLYFNDYSNKNL